MIKYKTRREIKNGIVKYVSTPIEESEEDNQNVSEETLVEDPRDKEIAMLTALVEALKKEIEKQSKEVPSSDVMAVAAASTYSCYS